VGLRSLRLGAVIVLAMAAASITCLVLAMHHYPGGTELDRHSVGHSFWFNFLCDLTGERALNGAPNATSRGLARAAMAALSVGLGAFWLILPAEFPGHRIAATVIRVAGTISVLGFFAVPVANGPWHAVAIFAAAVPGVLAASVGVVATVRYVNDGLLLGAAFGSMAAAAIDSILYAQRVVNDYRTCPPALPVFQRLTLLFVLAWGATTALRVLRQSSTPLRPPGT
jgi:hypothetical protein